MHSLSDCSSSFFDVDVVTKVGGVEKVSSSTPFLKSECDPFLCRQKCLWNHVMIPEAEEYFLMFRYKHWFQHPAQQDDRYRLIAEVQEVMNGDIISKKRFIIPLIEQCDMNEREVKLHVDRANWNECEYIHVIVLQKRLFSETVLTQFRMENLPMKAFCREQQQMMQKPCVKLLMEERRQEEVERRLSRGLFTRYWPIMTVNLNEPDVMDQDETQMGDDTEELAVQMAESLLG